MSDEFARALDGLMTQAREKQRREDVALCEIANMLARYDSARGELLRVGELIQQMRMPPVPQQPLGQTAVDEEWARIRGGAVPNGSYGPNGGGYDQ